MTQPPSRRPELPAAGPAHVGAGITPDVRMFADLFRIIAEHELSVPPEIAGAFRALATIEGTLSRAALRKTAADELISLVPMLRRLPRRLDRISASLEHGRLGLNVRLLADEGDRRYLTGLVHQLVLAFVRRRPRATRARARIPVGYRLREPVRDKLGAISWFDVPWASFENGGFSRNSGLP